MGTKQLIHFGLGATLLGLGGIGVFIPLLPTTPLVLASIYFFARSSKRAENYVLKNSYFGSFITNYRTKQGIPWKIKIRSVGFLWLSLIISMLFIQQIYFYIILGIVGLSVTAHILLMNTAD